MLHAHPRPIAFLVFFPLVFATAALAAEPPLALPEMTPAVRRESGRLSFELLPKSFQKNPQLEMTVVTEFTDYGRTLPEATAEKPVYYLGVATGLTERGNPVAGTHPPAQNYLGRLLQHSLTTNGFLAADKTHRPTLTLFFHWGEHMPMDYDERQLFPEKAFHNLLERATLVGGRTFQRQLSQRIVYGDGPGDHSARNEFLTSQASGDLYFVVVSAYDYAALVHGQRKLVWRSNLTVAATGVSMTDALPGLILTAGPYFGRPTPDSEILFRHVKRDVIQLGPAKVIETDVPLKK